MDISIFDVLGPVMIGPSSSHTAGAARLSRSAREIVKGDIACCIIETDETIPEDVEVSIQNNINVVYARVINIQ